MPLKIIPRSNNWNRSYDFTNENSSGFLIETKNGMAYFAWKFMNGNIKFYKCEQDVFEKSFTTGDEQEEDKISSDHGNNYLRYPIEK